MITELNNKNRGVSKAVSSKFSGVEYFGNSLTVKEKSGGKTHESLSPAETFPSRKISDNRILGALPEFEAARLSGHFDFVRLSAGKELYAAGENAQYVYFPETAVASEICDLEDGSTIETVMIGSDGATGLSAILGKRPSARRTKIIVSGNAWRIKTDALEREFARAGKMQTLLLDCINRHINQISQRLVCKTFHFLEKRLCGWLLMLHDRVKKNRLKMTQENIALLLGANRPSITLAALTLRNRGLIDYSRGGISILDLQKMKNSACECYSVLEADNSDRC